MYPWISVKNGITWIGVAILAASILGCSTSSSFEDLNSKLTEVELQLLQLRKDSATKQDIEALNASTAEQSRALLDAQQDLGGEIRELVSMIEQLEARLEDTKFNLQQLSQKATAIQNELQEIRTATERARSSSPQAPPPSTITSPNTPDPQTLYDTAYADYGRGNYDLAILGFRQYLETYPDTELADNATYWIGECYYHQSKFQQAIDQFEEVLTRYERSERVPSALLKKGYAYLELGQRAQGAVHLQNVICEHSGTDEAQLARQRLQELGIDVDC